MKQKASLSYKVIGICQEVQRNLGVELQEKYYQRELKKELDKKNRVSYKRHLRYPRSKSWLTIQLDCSQCTGCMQSYLFWYWHATPL